MLKNLNLLEPPTKPLHLLAVFDTQLLTKSAQESDSVLETVPVISVERSRRKWHQQVT